MAIVALFKIKKGVKMAKQLIEELQIADKYGTVHNVVLAYYDEDSKGYVYAGKGYSLSDATTSLGDICYKNYNYYPNYWSATPISKSELVNKIASALSIER